MTDQTVKTNLDYLREYLPEGTTVYTILRHVSPSGMTRWIDLYVIRDNKPFYLTGFVREALGYKSDRNHSGLKVGGCGMDMGCALVYDLSYKLFKNGYALEHRWM